MNINNIKHSAAIGSYANTTGATKTAPTRAKTDKVDIDPNRFSAERYAKNVAEELSAEVSPERLRALKDSIESGDYNIPADMLADALIGNV